MMEKGELVPNETILEMIKDAMFAHPESNGFLIDGYPRQVEQGVEFENKISPCEIVLYVDASDETLKKRLMKRGESSGRVDDNEATIKQRIKTFHDITKPVIAHYEKQNKVRKISSENDPDEVFKDVIKVMDKVEGFDFGDGKKIDVSPLKDAKVVFVVGGPGSGKVGSIYRIRLEIFYSLLFCIYKIKILRKR